MYHIDSMAVFRWGRMLKLILRTSIIGLTMLSLGARRAFALMPPLSPDELRSKSDLIIEADVIGVVLTCIEHDATWEYRTYRAWLLVRSVQKGPAHPDSTLEVAWEKKRWRSTEPEPTRGSFEPAFHPGDRVRAYLSWSQSRYAWRTVHWNALEVIDQGGVTLPTEIGHINFADSRRF